MAPIDRRLVAPIVPAGFVPTMQCKRVDRLPVGDQWRYELKLDGYRAEAIRTSTAVSLISRNQKDLTRDYPEVVDGVTKIGPSDLVIDGEIVALDSSGKPSFQALQHAPAPGRPSRAIFYFAFDLLHLDGKSLLALPLHQRKAMLNDLLRKAPAHVRFLPFIEGEPEEILTAVRQQALEGIVAKMAMSQYESDRRSGAWCKFKIGNEQEFVVGGYTRGNGARSPFGALIVGYYEHGKLRFASKVGTGFSNLQIRKIMKLAEPLRIPNSPFVSLPQSEGTRWGYGLTANERRTAVWLKPCLVCRVRFTEWTEGGHLRHPTFQGLGEDKNAAAVVRE